LVVINVPYSRFWTASTDMGAAAIVPVNGIQMAVPIAPRVRAVKVRYRRPSAATWLRVASAASADARPCSGHHDS
jgi:hypothetical protein